MGNQHDRVKGQLSRAKMELSIFAAALKRICTLSSQEHVIRAQMIAAGAVGHRYLTSVTVVPAGESPIVIDADGKIMALCPECQKPHKLGDSKAS